MMKSTSVEVSILMVAFNAAQFIPEALKGIEAQSMKSWELIVVEDGSNDGTQIIVSEFARRHCGHRIVYSKLKKNSGVAAARNRSLELFNGKIVAFLDADDVWTTSHLENLVKKLRDGHVLVVSPISIWDSALDRQISLYKPTSSQLNSPSRGLFTESFIQTSSCVAIPKETIERVGQFDEALRIGEDRDYWFRAVDNGGTIGSTASPTCRYLKHAESSMSKTLLVTEHAVKFYEKHKNTTCVPEWVARYYLAGSLRTHGRLSRKNNSNAARQIFMNAWKIWPLGFDLPLRAFLTSGKGSQQP